MAIKVGKPAVSAPKAPVAPRMPAPNTVTVSRPATISAPDARMMAGGGKYRVGGFSPEQLGAAPIPTENSKRSLFSVIVGRSGSGKNTLAYSAIEDGPVVVCSVVERGSTGSGRIQQYLSKGIQRKVLLPDLADPTSPANAERMWDEILRFLFGLYGFPGTLIIDTIDEMYEIGRLALNGRLEKVMQRDYGPINRAMNDVFGLYALDSCVTNLILISKGRDVYMNGENTGMMEPGGWKNATFMADGVVYLSKDTYGAGNDRNRATVLPVDQRIKGTIIKCPADLAMEGVVLSGESLKFTELKKRMLKV